MRWCGPDGCGLRLTGRALSIPPTSLAARTLLQYAVRDRTRDLSREHLRRLSHRESFLALVLAVLCQGGPLLRSPEASSYSTLKSTLFSSRTLYRSCVGVLSRQAGAAYERSRCRSSDKREGS